MKTLPDPTLRLGFNTKR